MQLADELGRLTIEAGQRAIVIAHSRGGQFGRAVAVRHPELVRGLVALGSPLNRTLGIHPLLRAEVALLAGIGTLGVPGLVRTGCLWGRCCRTFRADLAADFPEDVAFISVFSRQDRFVDWRSSLDPGARHREIATTHGGLVSSLVAKEALADELCHLHDFRAEPQ